MAVVRSGRVGANSLELFTRGALAGVVGGSQEWEKSRAMRKMGFSVEDIVRVPSVGISMRGPWVLGRGFWRSG